MDNSSDNITLNDHELQEIRERFVEEEDSSDSDSELEDYDPKSHANGSKEKGFDYYFSLIDLGKPVSCYAKCHLNYITDHQGNYVKNI